MKKVFKSKKSLAVLLVLVVVIIAGLTYAWFTYRTGSSSDDIELGRLSIATTYEVDTDSDQFEPGLSATKAGTISNTGTMAVLARVDLESTITIRSDDNGNPISNPYDIDASEVDGIDITFNEDYLGYMIDGDTFYQWFIDGDGNYYILIDGNVKADLEFIVDLDGSLGNLYQGATISYSKGWLATQVTEGALREHFDISLDDLTAVGDNDFSPTDSVGNYSEIQSRIAELIS